MLALLLGAVACNKAPSTTAADAAPVAVTAPPPIDAAIQLDAPPGAELLVTSEPLRPVVPVVLPELPEISWPREERLEPRVTRAEGKAVAVGNRAARAICT